MNFKQWLHLEEENKQPWEMTREEYLDAFPETRKTTTVDINDVANLEGTNQEQKRVRSSARYRELLERMKKFGFGGNQINPSPIVLRRTPYGGLQIEDGNHRIAAAVDAGIKGHIPVEIIEQPFWKDIVKKAIKEGLPVPKDADSGDIFKLETKPVYAAMPSTMGDTSFGFN